MSLKEQTNAQTPKLSKEVLEKAINNIKDDATLHPQLKKDVISMLVSYYHSESSGMAVELQSAIEPVRAKIKELTGIEVEPLGVRVQHVQRA